MSDARIVWILGAGASVGLGGPTLEKLLSLASEKDLKARYQGKFPDLFGPTALATRRLYHHGRGWPEGPVHPEDRNKPGERLWKHAEEYLDYLDTAAEKPDGVFAERLRLTLAPWVPTVGPSKPPPSASQLRTAARRLVAAECCGFLEDADVGSERWASYARWVRSLGRCDTLISFNYDRVIETITNTRARIVLPNSGDVAEATAAECCLVIKLHGSVDWCLDGKRITRSDDPRFAVGCSDEQMAIATPGPSKAKHANHEGFAQLWELAMGQVEEADAIVFVGYRIPHTDATARERLLRAIGTNRQEGRRVHIVLGPDVESAARLAALINFTGPGQLVHDVKRIPILTHPLYAEDFFGVVHRDRL